MIVHLVTSTAVLSAVLLASRLLPLTPRTRHVLLLIGIAKFAVPDAAIVALLRMAGLDLERVGREVVPTAFRILGGGAATAPAPSPALHIDWLLVAWLSVAALMMLRWGILRARTLRAVTAGAASPSAREHQLLKDVVQSLGIRSAVDLVRSAIVEAPAVVRVIRPVVVLPSAGLDDLTNDEARAVLLHECAHVARRDNLIAIFEMFAAAALWFHPLIHYALRQVAAAREEACDEVAADGARPETYLDALTKICRAAVPPRTAGVACMASPHIKRRVEHLMNYEELKRRAFPHNAVLLASTVVALLITPLTTTFATETSSADRFTFTAEAQRMPKPPGKGLRSAQFMVEAKVVENATGKVLMSPRVGVQGTIAAVVTSKDREPYGMTVRVFMENDGSGTATLDVEENGAVIQSSTQKLEAGRAAAPPAGEPMTMRVKDADLNDLLKTFGRMTGKKVTIAPGLTGRVTLDVADVPWEQVLEIIARQNKLEITVTADNILVNSRP